jgi:uncharacterized protein YdhG (YjbR/CyaY superfamily)
MRKKSSAATSSKSKSDPKTIDEYLRTVPEPARATLEKLRKVIKSAAPKATEVISYQMPGFRYQGMLVYFAAFKNHCSLFPGSAVMASHVEELKAYETSKGTIRFPIDKPLPAALVRKLVKARIADNEKRMNAKEIKAKAKKR